MEKQVNMGINDGDSFFAHQVSLNFSPTQFFIDFKNITPRIDERGVQPSLVMKHNVIMMDPFHLVKLQELIGKVLDSYQKEFGTIEIPKAIAKIEKRKVEGHKPEGKVQTTYFG